MLILRISGLLNDTFRYYAKHPGTPAAVADKARSLSQRLSEALIGSILGELNRTGYLWEQYNGQTGRGQRGHPFSGWTSLVTLAMVDDEIQQP